MIERIVPSLGLRVDGSSPWVDARKPAAAGCRPNLCEPLSGRRTYLTVPAPARRTNGYIFPHHVELVDGYGRRVTIPRGGWTAAGSIEAATEPDDRLELDPADSSLLAERMRTDVADLSQSAIAFLG